MSPLRSPERRAYAILLLVASNLRLPSRCLLNLELLAREYNPRGAFKSNLDILCWKGSKKHPVEATSNNQDEAAAHQANHGSLPRDKMSFVPSINILGVKSFALRNLGSVKLHARKHKQSKPLRRLKSPTTLITF
eukprot:GHVU01038783.1.p1 GENE.GHVU01038783.1~~GHVU01038783.1.p1  ORF type:complete len:135 (-),score=4.56 GHVU01038783.1:72-476(-)